MPSTCPECGADLRPGADVCWLCAYKSPVEENSPPRRHAAYKRQVALAIGMVATGLLMFPAAGIAFFVCCAAAWDSKTQVDPLVAGSLGGGVVVVLFILLFVHLSRKR
jgi:hypothetical protein